VIDLTPACEQMTKMLGGITDAQLSGPTPCDEYSVAGMIDHVDQVALGAAALARGEKDGMNLPGTGPDADDPDAGWRDRLSEHLRECGAAWQVPTAWEGEGNVAGSDMSNERWGKIALTELVVHGWDLAVATGQSVALPEPTLQACFEHVDEFVASAPFPELWGPPVPVVDDAPLLDRIVGLTGRTPQ